MGREVVYLICSIAKLEVTSDSPGTLLTRRFIEVVIPLHVGHLNSHQIVVFPRHPPEAKHFRHLRDDGHEPTVPFTAVVLRFYQHKSG